jgi:hypothetical protein
LTIDGAIRQVVMHVGPAAGDSDEEGYVLIVFDEFDPAVVPQANDTSGGAKIEELQGELTVARQRLQSMTEEYAGARVPFNSLPRNTRCSSIWLGIEAKWWGARTLPNTCDDSFDPLSNLIEVYIQRLRRKIDDGESVKLIRGAVPDTT